MIKPFVVSKSRFLSTCAFYSITANFQLFHKHFAMVALNLDSPTFYGPAGAAFLFQLFGEVFEFVAVERYTGDDGDTLTPAALCFPLETDNAVTFCMPDFIRAHTFINRVRAPGAHLAVPGGIDKPGTVLSF